MLAIGQVIRIVTGAELTDGGIRIGRAPINIIRMEIGDGKAEGA